MKYFINVSKTAINIAILNCENGHPEGDPNILNPSCGGEPQIKYLK